MNAQSWRSEDAKPAEFHHDVSGAGEVAYGGFLAM